jgi:hypothetical protein
MPMPMITRPNRGRTDWRKLPFHAARIATFGLEAQRLKRSYQAEGAKVRIFPRKVKAGGLAFRVWLVVARRPRA